MAMEATCSTGKDGSQLKLRSHVRAASVLQLCLCLCRRW